MMNIDQINEYLEKKHENENREDIVDTKKPEAEIASANAKETEVQETDTDKVTEDNNTAGSDVEKKEEEKTKPVEVQTPENKTEESKEKPKENPKKEYSKQEKIDFAFQKEKAKRKKLEARIKELEEENKKYKGLKLEDFKNDSEQFTNYLVDQKIREIEKKRLEDEYRTSKMMEAEEVNRQRIAECFPDEVEQSKYNELVTKNGKNFVELLDEKDPDQVVLGFLDDSPISPLLIRIMMTNKEYRDEVLGKSSPYARQSAMERLEQKVLWARQQLANKVKKEQQETTEQKPQKPQIPVVGSVTQSDPSNGSVIKDYNAELERLNKQRKYQTS